MSVPARRATDRSSRSLIADPTIVLSFALAVIVIVRRVRFALAAGPRGSRR
jgi:hypothetical protein